MKLADIRKEYKSHALDESHTSESPFEQFELWMKEALASEVPEPTAMNLSTINLLGRPSSRIVLLKGMELGGFVFYTNYQSDKGKDMEKTPFAALNFHWVEMERQVRIEGRVEKVPVAVSDEYFNSRPRGSRLGAHVSNQSQPIEGREVLEKRYEELLAQYGEDKPIERPEHWGGYVVIPDAIEFWQGRPSRLHDRILYTQDENGVWARKRLAP